MTRYEQITFPVSLAALLSAINAGRYLCRDR
jgi:hypothetical protein